ncbi:hypothetical protein [Streptomyces sp. NPDC090026]|uniref:hypothetical protein n=1 Tax=Streptomyces sp. NPDC090026 TaxID=3365923 RepID=UPI0037F4BA1F
MRTRTATAAAIAAIALTLTGCSTDTEPTTDKATPEELTPEQQASIRAAAGIPERPTGEARQTLLDALAKAAPDTIRYEDKAVEAARNQCSAINGGSERIDWMASQRFTYKDVTTTEEQGKAINQALKDLGFCNV